MLARSLRRARSIWWEYLSNFTGGNPRSVSTAWALLRLRWQDAAMELSRLVITRCAANIWTEFLPFWIVIASAL